MDAHHAQLGAYLLGLWGFPNPIVEGVAFHERPGQMEDAGLCLPRLIHIADRLVHQRGAEGRGALARELEPGLLESLGLVERWPAWLAKLDSLDSAEQNA